MEQRSQWCYFNNHNDKQPTAKYLYDCFILVMVTETFLFFYEEIGQNLLQEVISDLFNLNG